MNVINEIRRINDIELANGTVNTSATWHAKYAQSAWVYVGNVNVELTEGDIICIMSQYGEVEDINLVRDESTGKSRGFSFLKYEDPRSCVLAVDNLTGSKILDRSLRVDHVERYRLPKHLQEKEEKEEAEQLSRNKLGPGHAYRNQELASDFDITKGQDLFAPPPTSTMQTTEANDTTKSEGKASKQARKDARAQKRKEKEDRKKKKEGKRRIKEDEKERHRRRGRGERKHVRDETDSRSSHDKKRIRKRSSHGSRGERYAGRSERSRSESRGERRDRDGRHDKHES